MRRGHRCCEDAAMPQLILTLWLHLLLAVGLIGGGITLVGRWYRSAWAYDRTVDLWRFDPDLGWNGPTALLALGVALLVWSIAGGLIVRAVLGLASRLRSGGANAEPAPGPAPAGQVQRLSRPDGAELHVEVVGPEDAPPIVLTHGWGLNSDEWTYLCRELGDRFRLIRWDLPGLGRSKRPDNGDFRLETLAGHLEAVLGVAGGRPAVLLGHSIGGMIGLTFCRRFATELHGRVAGLVFAETTYINPVRTARYAGLFTAIERPVLVPLLHLTIWLSPLVWLSNILSYFNGSAHSQAKRTGFAGTQSPGQVDFVARFNLQAPPAVLARGMFAMLEFDETATLPTIDAPTVVVVGDRDPVCRPDAGERIAREVPGARLVRLTPARHMGVIEHHAEFARAVAGFAAGVTGVARV